MVKINDFLEETLQKAGKELKSRFETKLNIQIKKDESVVTDADLASEAVVIGAIKKYFPNDLILSEEAGLSSQIRKPGSMIWIIDPLDGTSNFANGFPYFCISIGRGQFSATNQGIDILSGGIYDPVHEKMYLAERGAGSFCNGLPMKIATERDLSRSFLVTGFYYLKDDDLNNAVTSFLEVARSCSSIRRAGAAALDLAMVASGVFDGFWEYGLQPWDIAAGSLLVSESGGLVENYYRSGLPWDIESKGILAGNKNTVQKLHALIK